ncbi:MAG TPA: hypothetical protein ENO24_05215 [Chloroflexi bacterium]|nr:hypothetical protein [Chloroflexota bacterium]
MAVGVASGVGEGVGIGVGEAQADSRKARSAATTPALARGQECLAEVDVPPLTFVTQVDSTILSIEG